MSTFSVKIEGLDELTKSLEAAPGIVSQELVDAMDQSTRYVKGQIRDEIRSNRITNTGNLARSVAIEPVKPNRGRVYVSEMYGAAVEFGSRPHFPPVAPLERWAQTKLGKSGIGFLIARKIARVGTKANPFVAPAFKNSIEYINQRFQSAIKEVVLKLAK